MKDLRCVLFKLDGGQEACDPVILRGSNAGPHINLEKHIERHSFRPEPDDSGERWILQNTPRVVATVDSPEYCVNVR